MKKGLLLSIVASTMIFAGGDIAPLEPATSAPSADCSDFYGSVGAYYETVSSDDVKGIRNDTGLKSNLFGKQNSRFDVVATIGVEKTIFSGIGFAAEVSAWSSVGSRIAQNHRVDGSPVVGSNSASYEGGTLSQLYLSASFGNTGVKAGRFSIPGSLSPLLRTGSTAGSKDTTFDGVLVANTDLADTTLYGVWVYAVHGKTGNDVKVGKGGDASGAFALGFQNKSIANTTITAIGYYGADYFSTPIYSSEFSGGDLKAGAVSINSAFGDYGVDAQFTYVTGAQEKKKDLDATITAGIKLSGNFGPFDAWAIAAYENDGKNPAALAGGAGALIGDQIDFDFGREGYGVGAEIGYKVWTGRTYARVSYMDYKDKAKKEKDNTTRATVGYTFKVANIDFKAEYQYAITKFNDSKGKDLKTNRVRLEAAYKF